MKRMLIGIFLLLSLIGSESRAIDQPYLPSEFNMIMLAGADYMLTLQLKDSTGSAIDLSDLTYKAQFRSAPAPAGIVYATYSTLKRSTTTLDVKLSAAQTRALSGKSGLWDLRQTTAAGWISYILTGKAAVKPTVTQ